VSPFTPLRSIICVSTRVSVNEATIALSVTSNDRVTLSTTGPSGARTARFLAAVSKLTTAIAIETVPIVRGRMGQWYMGIGHAFDD
jgi:hypothetical protein